MLVKLEATGCRGGGVVHATVTGAYSKITDLKGDFFKGLLSFSNLEDFYLEHNGKILRGDDEVAALFGGGEDTSSRRISVVPRLVGGKGGFGSMLRAIGAQIEKTTNRDACRDLSGRRLRDINEEQRLKKWFAKQAEREIERREARKRKLDKLRQVADGPPLPKIDDQQFLQQREEIVEAVFEAVDEAFREGPSETDALAIHKDSANSASSSNQDTGLEAGSGKEPPFMCSSGTDGATDSASASIVVKERKLVKKTMFDEDLESESSSSEEENQT